jgi:uncharacterized RDD family membrane protein YckC
MSDSGRRPDPELLDRPLKLPLEAPAPADRPAQPSGPIEEHGELLEPLPLFPEPPAPAAGAPSSMTSGERLAPPGPGSEPAPIVGEESTGPQGLEPARLIRRLAAGMVDGLVLLAAGLALAVACVLLGARLGREQLVPLAAFLALFSFVYTVVPLWFWGQTLGMRRARLLSRAGRRRQALTLGQTAARWVGGLLTAALLGLPVLLALRGRRSLADLLSGSRTYQLPL